MTHPAYGFARLSARRAGLLSNDQIASVRLSADGLAEARALRALDIDLETKRFGRLVSRYRAILNCYRDGAPLIAALLGLHEIENVKLGWRAIAQRVPVERWTPLWLDLQDLARVSIAPFTDAHTLFDVASNLEETLFAGIVRDVFTAHAKDLAAAELAFDRWASLQVFHEIRQLPAAESQAAKIAEALVRSRDEEIVIRRDAYGLSEAAAQALRTIPEEKTWADLQMLCSRAFRGQALRLAPAVAYAALAERDYRIARALAGRGGDRDLDPAVDRVISGIGARA